jgi:hypothetical protein
MLDEHLLNESVCFLVELVVMTLTQLADLSELRIAKCATGVAESLERVFGLARHDDVTYQAEEVALASGIGKVLRFSEHRAENFLSGSGFSSEYCLVILEHALVLAHARDVAAAEVAKPAVLGLGFVILE